MRTAPSTSNFGLPNFRTVLPLPILLRGLCTLLDGLYQPDAFFARAYDSLKIWDPKATQKPPYLGMYYNLRVLFSSVWRQGIRSQLPAQLLEVFVPHGFVVLAVAGQALAGLHGVALCASFRSLLQGGDQSPGARVPACGKSANAEQ